MAQSAILNTACILGTARRCLSQAAEYARSRYQGGGVIARYDAVRLMLSHNETALATCAAALAECGRKLRQPSTPHTAANALRTHAATGRTALHAALDGVQILGGYGFIREFGQERRLRDIATLMLLPLDGKRALLLADWLDRSAAD